MAWTYSDWRSQTTSAAKLSRLRLHMQEITDAIHTRTVQVGADGKSLSRETLMGLLTSLEGQEKSLAAAAATGGGRAYVRLSRANN